MNPNMEGPGVFKSRTRDEWTAVFEGPDACVTPVPTPWEAHSLTQPGTANLHRDRWDSPARIRPAIQPQHGAHPASRCGALTDAVLSELGYSTEGITNLRAAGAVG